MNMVDDVRGVGVIKMMMVDDVGEGGVKNDQKSDDVICGRPLMRQRSYHDPIQKASRPQKKVVICARICNNGK